MNSVLTKVSKVRMNFRTALLGRSLGELKQNDLTFREMLLKAVKHQKKNTTQHAVIGTIISAILLIALI